MRKRFNRNTQKTFFKESPHEYCMEIEGLMVRIWYEYEEGTLGDYWTPPTGDSIEINEWELVGDTREGHPEVSDEEWKEWMELIDDYVWEEAEWDIREWMEEWDDIWRYYSRSEEEE